MLQPCHIITANEDIRELKGQVQKEKKMWKSAGSFRVVTWPDSLMPDLIYVSPLIELLYR
jgi:hypothetical protein